MANAKICSNKEVNLEVQVKYLHQRGIRALAIGMLLLGVCGSLEFVLPAVAAPTNAAPNVKAELKAFRVVDGKLQEAKSANPGDLIEYQAEYTNVGGAAAQNFSPLLPIPSGLAYVGSTAFPAKFLASTDGKNFAPAPLMRSVKNPDGTTKMVAVPLQEYRALRWQIGTLASGESVIVKARARVKTFADSK